MKIALHFLFLLSVSVACAQSDSLRMFVKTTELSDTVQMTRAVERPQPCVEVISIFSYFCDSNSHSYDEHRHIPAYLIP